MHVQLPPDPGESAGAHLDNGHDLPRRAAEPRALRAGADTRAVQDAPPAGRAEGHNPPDGVLPLQRARPQSAGHVPGAGVRVMRLADNDSVVAFAAVEHLDESEKAEDELDEETTESMDEAQALEDSDVQMTEEDQEESGE